MINSRQKGAQGERELAKFLEEYGWESKRGQQHAGSPDSPDVISTFPWHIEGKRVEKSSPLQWMLKATEGAGGKKEPMVFWRPNRGRWMIFCWADQLLPKLKKLEQTMKTEDFKAALKQAYEAGYRQGVASGHTCGEHTAVERFLAEVSRHPGQELTLTLKTKETERND